MAEEKKGILYLCGTPIGNLEDITFRAVRVLGEVDVIYAEDTRRAQKLLTRYNIRKPVVSYYQHNCRERIPEILALMSAGKNVALVSDAGMPGLSDPGQELVARVREEGYTIVPVPGPSAVVTALAASGIHAPRFVFEGFLPRRSGEKRERLEALRSEPRAVVIFESPRRLVSTLADLEEIIGDRKCAVLRELTKLHEEVLVGKISDLRKHFNTTLPRGEITLVIEGKTLEKSTPGNLEDIYREVNELLRSGQSLSHAVREVAQKRGISKNKLYREMLRQAKEMETGADA